MEYYIEKINNSDVIVHLGLMKKAIVIRKTIKGNFLISESSFFPFTKDLYDRRFDTMESATKEALDYFGNWFSQTNLFFNDFHQKNDKFLSQNNYLIE